MNKGIVILVIVTVISIVAIYFISKNISDSYKNIG